MIRTGRLKYRSLILLVSVMFAFGQSMAQSDSLVFRTVRKTDQKAISDVIVKVATLAPSSNSQNRAQVLFSDAKGEVKVKFTEPLVVEFSHIGFASVRDTILSSGTYMYELEISSQDIQDVVVTGQYGATSPEKSVYEIKILKPDMLKAKGANNLRDALQNEIGIDLGQDQVFGSNIGINGISGEGVKIMVDGVPLVGRLDGKLDLSQINISQIERIEIVEGPLSVMYGTDAMGGVINIITKTYQKEKVNLNLKGFYETVGQYNVELNTGFSFKRNQIYLSGGRYFFDGYSAYDTVQRFKEWKPKEQYFADAKYSYSSNKLRISLTGSFFRELLIDRGQPKRTLQYTPGDTSWTYTGLDVHYLTYRPRGAVSVMYKFKTDYQLDAILSYSGFMRYATKYTKNLVTLNEQEIANPDDHDTSKYHLILFRGMYSMPAWQKKIFFQIGAEVNQEYTQQKRIEGNKKQNGDYAAFGSVRLALIQGLDIQPAIRFSYNTRFSVPLIPSLNIKYSYLDKFTIRASYGRGYRAPSLKELYLTFFDVNHALKGNENLKPESGHNVNGSFNYYQKAKSLHQLTYSVSGFYNQIQNKIDWLLIAGNGITTDTFQYFNLKKYITYGGDVSFTYRWKGLHASMASQLTKYQLSVTDNNSSRVKMTSVDVSLKAGYMIPKALINVNVFYKYNGAKPLFAYNNSVQTGTRSAFHSLDITASRSFWKERIQLTVGGRNLVGVSNIQASNVSGVGHNFGGNSVNVGWGRTFFTSLVLHFGI